MDDETHSIRIYEKKLILGYCAAGFFILAILLRFAWQREGGLTDSFDWERWRLVGAAAVFGLGLGWLWFPRALDIPD